MMTIYLKDFVTTGRFGPVELGMTIDQVLELFGEPERTADFENGHAIITYAYYEFFYLKESRILYGIQNDHLASFPNLKTGRVNNKRDICFTNNKFTVDIWFLKINRFLTLKQVMNNLEKEGIEFVYEILHSDYKNIRLKNGVQIDFDDYSGLCFYHEDTNSWSYSDKIENEYDHILCGIGHFDLSLVNEA